MVQHASQFAFRPRHLYALIRLGAATALVVSVGCSGRIATDNGEGDDDGAGGQGGDGGDESGGSGAAVAARCGEAEATNPPAPLRRLSAREYANTLRDLFGTLKLPEIKLPAEASVDGFNNSAAGQTATSGLTEAYMVASKAVAEAITPKTLFGCDPAAAGCARGFLKTFGLRAFRRPLLDEELNRYEAFFTTSSSKWGAETSAKLLVQTLLVSSSFLYRPEPGLAAPSANARQALSGYEVATRLSYFFWQSLPDAALLQAAADGELGNAKGIQTQARRLLADPRAKAAVADFSSQWLRLDTFENVTRDPKVFPAFKPSMPAALRESAERFVADGFWADGDNTVANLLTKPKAFVNADLAPLYGVQGVTGSDFKNVAVDDKQRTGLLSQAGLLASLAHADYDSPIYRGIYVMRRLLCLPPPPAPKNVPMIEAPKLADKPMTTRQRVAETHSRGTCMSCHASIDSIGFLFSHYDALGQYRERDNNLPVDASGDLKNIDPSVDGSYDGLVSFSERLASSPLVATCAANHVFRFAAGREEDTADACAINQALSAAKGNLPEFMVRLASSDAFRFRSAAAQ